jgi:mannose-6-phosphate isomerase-like protein (cupin superfamily)
MGSYTIRNLKESQDLAVEGGFSEMQEARFPWRDLDAEQTGLAHIVVHPGKRQPFGHHQKEAEEIFLVLSGSGRVKLDDEIEDVGPLDAIRVSPPVNRAFEAGSDGLELIAFGPHFEGTPRWFPTSGPSSGERRRRPGRLESAGLGAGKRPEGGAARRLRRGADPLGAATPPRIEATPQPAPARPRAGPWASPRRLASRPRRHGRGSSSGSRGPRTWPRSAGSRRC